MVVLSAAVLILSTVLSAGEPGPRSAGALSELTGEVLDQLTRKPLAPATPVAVELCHTDTLCVATAEVGPDGKFVLRAPPAAYEARVRINGEIARTEAVNLAPGSWRRDFTVQAPPVAVATSRGGLERGPGKLESWWEILIPSRSTLVAGPESATGGSGEGSDGSDERRARTQQGRTARQSR